MEVNRKRNRLKGYDYTKDGWYFVTICIKNRQFLFGNIDNQKIILNKYGEHTQKCWKDIPSHFPNVRLDEFVVMPNHVHGIIIIDNTKNNIENKVGNKDFCSNVGNKDFCSLQPWQTKLSKSLSSIIRGFKIGVTKYFKKNQYINFKWQKSFYDHVIRTETSLNNIRNYIKDNPLRWDLEKDHNHLSNIDYDIISLKS